MKKKLTLIIFIPILFLGIAQDNHGQVSQRVSQMAIHETNKQIDSVYSSIPPYIDAIRNDFRALRSHMDTINAELIMVLEKYETASIERDKAVRDNLFIIHQNTLLRSENKIKDEKIDFMKKAPHFFMIFITVLASSFFGSGVSSYLSKRKHAK